MQLRGGATEASFFRDVSRLHAAVGIRFSVGRPVAGFPACARERCGAKTRRFTLVASPTGHGSFFSFPTVVGLGGHGREGGRMGHSIGGEGLALPGHGACTPRIGARAPHVLWWVPYLALAGLQCSLCLLFALDFHTYNADYEYDDASFEKVSRQIYSTFCSSALYSVFPDAQEFLRWLRNNCCTVEIISNAEYHYKNVILSALGLNQPNMRMYEAALEMDDGMAQGHGVMFCALWHEVRSISAPPVLPPVR
ncbi:hypothetical protein GUJ93_ZPchr0004g38713 [Zizania palustris]|uniref:Uncharacterized protein n=1 Tax=Zizania palustris TaxID=103762 RepID=A0A8J5SBF9_ZIZPA|nr:hypothetical protein GUJ93_ZPchr0004g38713 [Zizania palustris]